MESSQKACRRAGTGCVVALLASALLGGIGDHARATDLSPPVAAVPPGWTFRFTPYGWLISLNGTSTVRGRSANVNASFIKLIEDTWGKGGTLIGLMGDVEARYGPFAFMGDLVWTRLGLSRSGVRSRSVAPGIAGSLGAAFDLKIEMAIVEFGAAYEVARLDLPVGSTAPLPLAFDLLAGGRYWHQKADLSFNLAGTTDVGDLELALSRAIARSGSVDWVDPFVGARARLALAPGQEFFLRGDVGGFGAGSRFSWQAIAGYGFDFATQNGITYSGVIGYRALSVDYAQGEGRRRYEFDMIVHGPVLGISARF